jgi:hypothetical protein
MRPAFVEERYMEVPAAMSAADPTKSYAPGKSHEISRCTPYPAGVPREDDTKRYTRTPQYAPSSPHGSPYVGEPYQHGSRRTSKDAEPTTTYAKGAGVDGANLAKVLSGRLGPSRAMLAKLQAAIAQDR